MKANLETALKHVLVHEGGFVHHKADPGGATNRGVTQRVYDAFRDRHKQARRSVRAITAEEVATIYKRQYWDAVKGDDLPSGLDYAMFDYAVNSGPGRAIKDLQRELGVRIDGAIGNVTLSKANEADVYDLIDRLCARRMRFLKGLRHWPTFGKGWTRRVTDVLEIALAMATDPKADTSAVHLVETPAKAEETPRESVTESQTMQASAVQIGSGAAGIWGAITQLDGTDRTLALVFIGVIVVTSLWIARERVKAWAEGWR